MNNTSIEQKLKDIFESPIEGATTVERLENVNDKMESMELVVSSEKSNIKTIEDKEYITSTLKNMINLGMAVLNTLNNDLKLGSPGHVGENFSLVYKSLTESVQRLMELNLKLYDITTLQDHSAPKEPNKVENNQTNIFVGNGRDINEYLKKVLSKQKEDSELRSIDLSKELESLGE